MTATIPSREEIICSINDEYNKIIQSYNELLDTEINILKDTYEKGLQKSRLKNISSKLETTKSFKFAIKQIDALYDSYEITLGQIRAYKCMLEHTNTHTHTNTNTHTHTHTHTNTNTHTINILLQDNLDRIVKVILDIVDYKSFGMQSMMQKILNPNAKRHSSFKYHNELIYQHYLDHKFSTNHINKYITNYW